MERGRTKERERTGGMLALESECWEDLTRLGTT